MWGFVLSFLKNPIFSLIADKTIGEVKHYLEIKKIERVAEIEALKSVQVAQVEASEKSLKDEWLTLVFTGVLLAHFFPQTRDYMIAGWEILKSAPDMFWWIVLAIVSGSFGINVMDKFKK
jgi:hypothetical protein